MATATITWAKATAGDPPAKPGEKLRRIAHELTLIANDIGDQGLTGASVTFVLNDSAGTLAVAGGPLPATRTITVS